MKANLCRHDLIFLTERGQRYAWEHREDREPESEPVQRLFQNLPGIYRTQPPELAGRMAALGFSLPIQERGGRRRIASQAPMKEISAVLSPWDLCRLIPHLPSPAGPALEEARQAALSEGLVFGLFGSAALQAVTGLPYLHKSSDLDIIIQGGAVKRVERFYQSVMQVERAWNVAFDAELMLKGPIYIKLRELMAGGKTVLAKGASRPQLLLRQAVWETMAALPQ